MYTCMPELAVQNYATYPSMPGALRALCPVRRGVITGIRPYARYHGLCVRVLRKHGTQRKLLDVDAVRSVVPKQ